MSPTDSTGSTAGFDRRFGLAAVGVLCIALLGLKGLPSEVSRVQQSEMDDPYAAFCLPPPAAAIVASDAAPEHRVPVRVPFEAPAFPVLEGAAGRPIQVRKGQIVEFRVMSAREGAVAVHGLSDLVRLAPNRQGIVRFRAIYSGRFPLHFHGRDGSHFEVSVLEIRE